MSYCLLIKSGTGQFNRGTISRPIVDYFLIWPEYGAGPDTRDNETWLTLRPDHPTKREQFLIPDEDERHTSILTFSSPFDNLRKDCRLAKTQGPLSWLHHYPRSPSSREDRLD